MVLICTQQDLCSMALAYRRLARRDERFEFLATSSLSLIQYFLLAIPLSTSLTPHFSCDEPLGRGLRPDEAESLV